MKDAKPEVKKRLTKNLSLPKKATLKTSPQEQEVASSNQGCLRTLV